MRKHANDNGFEEPSTEFASPACLMHRLDPATGKLLPEADEQQRIDVLRWRRAERERLIGLRLAIPASERRALSGQIARNLDGALEASGGVADRIVSAYWPFRGEPDLRPWLETVVERGGTAALPVVVARGAPLAFRCWRQGQPLQPGVWNIPVPSNGPDATPDFVIAPVVGFDPACYRLGYGGGFFDRTLAAMTTRPRIIGVGYALQAIRTIYPQVHDIPMDMIVTENGILTPAGAEA